MREETPPPTCHLSHVMCNILHITFYIFVLLFFFAVEGLLLMGLPRQVLPDYLHNKGSKLQKKLDFGPNIVS